MDDTKLATAIIGGAVTLAGSILAYFKTRPIKVKPIEDKKNKKARSISNHSVFFFMDDMEMDIKNSFIVPSIITDHAAKQEVFKDIMINKIQIWRKLLERVASFYKCSGDCANCKISLAESRAFHMRLLDEGIILYSNYYKSKPYNLSEMNAIKICMVKFNNLHLPNGDFVSSVIESTHSVNEYLPVFCPITASGLILDAYKYTFHKMLEDIREAIITMNGDLKGLTFEKKNYSFIEK